jgi:hypothetical protein
MKRSAAPTLSLHLLREAERFRMYPQRVYRTRGNLDYEKVFDNKVMGKIVEWRKTFVPSPMDELALLFEDPVLLDEFYCRDLLKAIPGIVERTAKLSHLTLSGISKSEFVYLREAATCYLLGLPAAAVALARAAIENSLRRKLAKFFGKAAVDGEALNNLLDMSRRGKTLSDKGRDLARKVRVAAKIVLHAEPGAEPDALGVLEDAKTVILELSRH